MKKPWIQVSFAVAAFYDGLLGLVFLFVPGLPFELFEVTPPNHVGYVQFPAALLLIFAIMFTAIAKAPLENRKLIIYGILLKVAYCGTTFWHWSVTGIPGLWKPFAIIDLLMGLLFIWAWIVLGLNKQPVA